MSLLGHHWHILNTDPNLNLVDKLLINRGLTKPADIENFFKADLKTGLHDPFLLKDMDKAVARISLAIKNKERVIVFGDYDVDGVTGTAILVYTLQKLGAQVSYRLPHRVEDGYGLNIKFIDEFASLGISLVITVDCGIACRAQIAAAKNKQIDVIVTDHHTIPSLPPELSFAIIHPKQTNCPYPFKELTGAGVAFKLSKALFNTLAPGELDNHLEGLLELASLGTVADCAALLGENRVLVKHGLDSLKNSKWAGLRKLKEQAGIKPETDMDTYTLGFYLAPRLNAAGRIDSAYFALQLLLNTTDKALQFAEKLEKLNQKRQKLTAEALQKIEVLYPDMTDEPAIIAHHPDFHVGIVGLLAGKLAEKYFRPAFVMEDRGDTLVGSARSRDGFSVIEALQSQKEHLQHFGGHQQAGGFSLDKQNLENFKEGLQQYAKEHISPKQSEPRLMIDCELQSNQINFQNHQQITTFAPFGIQNTVPLFLLRDVGLNYVKTVGSEGKHLKFQAAVETGLKPVSTTQAFEAIGFNLGSLYNQLRTKRRVDVVFELDKNVWNGEKRLQMKVKDVGVCS